MQLFDLYLFSILFTSIMKIISDDYLVIMIGDDKYYGSK